jgi:hypothetical protein
MSSLKPTPLAAALLAILFTAACSDNRKQDVKATSEARVFSDEDRRVTRALSLGNATVLDDLGTPQERAAACHDALVALQAQLLDAGALNQEMRNALALAVRTYDRQAGPRSQPTELPPGSFGGSHIAEDEEPNAQEMGQTALACIRRLEAQAAS